MKKDDTNLQVQSTSKSKLNYRDLSNYVWYVMKTKQDNDATNCTGAIYDENDNELS